MSLAILVPLVVLGVALIVAAVHFSGLSRPSRVPDSVDELAALFALDYPLERVSGASVDKARQIAFLMLESGRTGVIQAFGDRYVTRLLTPADLASVATSGPALMLKTLDFTWGGGSFAMQNTAAAAALAARLSGNKKTKEAA